MQQGEVALTSGLTFCLNKDPKAATAFVDLIHRRAQTSFGRKQPDRWQAEWIDDHGQRPDIVGWVRRDPHVIPSVMVEAKISAGFSDRQVSKYVEHHQVLLERSGEDGGLLVVLVPDDRVDAAAHEVGIDLGRLGATGASPWTVNGPALVHVVVLSWTEILTVMEAAAGPAVADIQQLAGASRVLRVPDIPAISPHDLGGNWQHRIDDLRAMIDRVTKQATATLRACGMNTAPLPWQPNPSEGLLGGFRYIGEPGQPNLAVGIAAPGALSAELDTRLLDSPLWIRWHRATTDAERVQERLRSKGLPAFRDRSGLVWMPVDLTGDVGLADRQIDSLVDQVVAAYEAARRPDPAQSGEARA